MVFIKGSFRLCSESLNILTVDSLTPQCTVFLLNAHLSEDTEYVIFSVLKSSES
jgi:hypothetical protein